MPNGLVDGMSALLALASGDSVVAASVSSWSLSLAVLRRGREGSVCVCVCVRVCVCVCVVHVHVLLHCVISENVGSI